MENTSKQHDAISRRDIAYYRRRHQNRVFSELAKFFAGEAENGRTTRKAIAQKLTKDPAQITRWLSSPSNLELDTISDLLLAMGAEMDHSVIRFIDRPKLNFAHPLVIAAGTATNAPPPTTFKKQTAQLPANKTTVKIQETAATTTPTAVTLDVSL
jgi:hypothetical protein